MDFDVITSKIKYIMNLGNVYVELYPNIREYSVKHISNKHLCNVNVNSLNDV